MGALRCMPVLFTCLAGYCDGTDFAMEQLMQPSHARVTGDAMGVGFQALTLQNILQGSACQNS